MPRLTDAEVTLLADGVPLPEYKVITTGDHEVSCYVPSETGKVGRLRLPDNFDSMEGPLIEFSSTHRGYRGRERA